MNPLAVTGRYGRLYANRAVAVLTGAQLFSRIGDQFVFIGILWEVLALTHQPSRAGLALMAYTLAGVGTGLFAGSVLDRFPRRSLMLFDNCLRTVLIGSVAALGFVHALTLPLILILTMLAAVASSLTIVGARAYLPLIVPEELLTTAFAADFSQTQTAQIVGPALAGLVTARFGPVVTLGAAAACYALFVALAIFIPKDALDAGPRPENKPLSWREELKGARYLLQQPVLRAMTGLILVSNIFIGLTGIALAFLSQQQFGMGARGQGFMLASEAIGSIIAGLVIGALHPSVARGKALVVANMLFGCTFFFVGFAASIYWACALLFIAGFADAAFFVWMSEIRQRIPPQHLQARVVGASMVFNVLGVPVGDGLGGFAVGLIGPRRVFHAVGVVLVVYSLFYLWRGPLRNLT